MTAAVSSLYQPQVTPRPAQLVKPSIDRRTLAEICLCAAPSLAATAAGTPSVGAAIYFSLLFAIFTVHLITRQPHRFLALLIGTIPPMMIFRGYFFYNSPQILFLTGLLLVFELQRPAISRLWRDPLMKSLILGTLVYRLIGVILTGSYVPNFRALELAFAVSAIYVLNRRRNLLCTALLGIGSFRSFCKARRSCDSELDSAWLKSRGNRLGNPISLAFLPRSYSCSLFCIRASGCSAASPYLAPPDHDNGCGSAAVIDLSRELAGSLCRSPSDFLGQRGAAEVPSCVRSRDSGGRATVWTFIAGQYARKLSGEDLLHRRKLVETDNGQKRTVGSYPVRYCRLTGLGFRSRVRSRHLASATRSLPDLARTIHADRSGNGFDRLFGPAVVFRRDVPTGRA